MNQHRASGSKAADPEDTARTDAETAHNIRRGIGAMIIAMVVLAFLNSAGFTTYARDLPGNAFSDWLVNIADQWHELMTAAGLTTASEDVREFFLSLKETEW